MSQQSIFFMSHLDDLTDEEIGYEVNRLRDDRQHKLDILVAGKTKKKLKSISNKELTKLNKIGTAIASGETAPKEVKPKRARKSKTKASAPVVPLVLEEIKDENTDELRDDSTGEYGLTGRYDG